MFHTYHRAWRTIGTLLLVASFLISPAGINDARADTDAPQDTPITVVTDADFNEWNLSDGMLYWAKRCYGGEFRGPGYLKRKPSFGSIVRLLSTVLGTECVTYLLMDADSSGLFFYTNDNGNHLGQAGGNSIYHSPSGSPYAPHTKVVTPNTNDRPKDDLVVDGDYIYWVSNGNRVLRIKKDGTGLQAVTGVRTNLTDMLVGGGRVYWLDSTGLHRASLSCDTLPCIAQNLDSAPGDHLLRTTSWFFSSSTIYWVASGSPQRIRKVTCSGLIIIPVTPIPFSQEAAERDQPLAEPVEAQAIDDLCGAGIDFYTAPENPDSTPGSPEYWQLGQPAAGGGYLFWREMYNAFSSEAHGRLRRKGLAAGPAQNIAVNLGNSDGKVFTDSVYVYFADNGIKKLSHSASAIVHDMAANAVEVTQGIQNLNNGVPLVADKTTYVRGFGTLVSGADTGSVSAYLYGTRGGNPLPGSPIAPLNGPHPLTDTTFDRDDIDDSWLFHLPSSWRSAGTVNLELRVDPVNSYDDPNPGNNSLVRTVSFNNKAPICAVFIPVRTHSPAASTDLASFWPMVDMAKRMLPTKDIKTYKQNSDVAELQVCWAWIFPYPCFGPYELKEDTDKILASLWIRDQFSDDPDECDDANATTHYIGLVHPSTSTDGLNGSGRRPGDQLLTKMPPLDAAPLDWQTSTRVATFPHELGHNYNRKHVDCGGPTNTDNGYPYTNPDRCRIDDRPETNPDTHFGFDIDAQEPIAPDSTRDLMAYGTTRWPSDYTWKAIYNRIDNSSVAASGIDLAAAGGVVLVNGTITRTVSQGELDYAWVLPTTTASASQLQKWQSQIAAQHQTQELEAAATTYMVRLVGAGSEVLAEQPAELLILEDTENDTVGFGAILPEPSKQVRRVQLLADGSVIDSRAPGPGKPVVSISKPAGGETVDLSLTVKWNGTDPNPKDVLLYTVQYSPDNGGQWRTLVSSYASPGNQPNVTLNFPNLDDIPGSNGPNARIRVVASDGYNTTIATSNKFTVLDRKPQPHILSPIPDEVLEAGGPVLLRGLAYDPETGLVADGSLSWKIDGQGVGTGEELNVDGLAAGNHTAKLTATDLAAQKASVQNNFQILPLRLPLSASPTMDGFCNDATYSNGTQIQLPPYGDGSRASVRLIRSSGHLWACFSGLKPGSASPGAVAGLRVDVNNSRDAQAQSNDYEFLAGEDGGVSTKSGNGAGGFDNPGPGGLHGQITSIAGTWNAELRIEKAVLGNWGHLVGLTLGHYDVSAADDNYAWPRGSLPNQPNTWSAATLGTTPSIASLSPYTITAGSPQFELVVAGSSFVSDTQTTVYWGSKPLPTTFISTTKLSSIVGAELAASPARVQVTVHNPGVDMESNPVNFDVVGPEPVINSLTPQTVMASGGGFNLTVKGTDFAKGASVMWNGVALPTTFVNASQLTAQIDSARIAQGQMVGVSVLNPAPDGKSSNAATLTVEPGNAVYLPSVFK